jgi:lysophospholipase L1-like esterase
MGDAGGASAFVANVKSYCLAMRAAGWSKIVVLTVLPRTFSGFNDWRNSVNALIVADSSFYDALVRLDLDPVIGCDACAANTTYYNADGLHPNTTGENVIAADLVPVLQGVLQ